MTTLSQTSDLVVRTRCHAFAQRCQIWWSLDEAVRTPMLDDGPIGKHRMSDPVFSVRVHPLKHGECGS